MQCLEVCVTADDCVAAMAGMVGSLGHDGFGGRALAALNGPVQAASWSVYRLHPGLAPVLHLAGSQGVADGTGSCFAVYRDGGLYRRDGSFDRLRHPDARAGEAQVLHMRADEAPNEEHRDAIYRAHAMLERLSVAALEEDGSVLAVNLYHHEHQGPFSDAERERFGLLAPLVLATVRRHLQLTLAAGPADPRARLLAECPGLTTRELDVCERLLRGWSYDGIALDLGVSLATVKTYRARAFGRLGLHFRSELFARFATRQ